jgi:hypothetical protein
MRALGGFFRCCLLPAACCLLFCSCSFLVRAFPTCGDGEAQPGELCFTTQVISVDGFPESVIFSDFDGDGDLDLLNANAAGALILVPAEGGEPGAPQLNAQAGNLFALAAADLNGDRALDIAVTNPGLVLASGDPADAASELVILLTQGGQLGAPVQVTTGRGPGELAVGDIDGALGPDILTSDVVGGTVTVLKNNGAGGFTSAATLALPGVPAGLALGDLNGDGLADFVVAINAVGAFPGDAAGDFVQIFLNDPAIPGTFQAPIQARVGLLPQGVKLGDLDGDGDLDLVVADRLDSAVSVLQNTGAGTFGEEVRFATDVFPIALVLADFDKDSDLDIAATSGNGGATTVSLLTNDGAGSFTGKRPIAAGEGSQFIDAGDFNGDGLPDLVLSDINEATLRLLLSDP